MRIDRQLRRNTGGAVAKKLDREDAVKYAAKYWDRPCSDGYFMTAQKAIYIDQERKRLNAPASEGWEAVFVPEFSAGGKLAGESAVFQKANGDEKLIHRWDGLADCAHFICQCLKAGDVKVHEMSVPALVKKLRGRSDVKILGLQLNREQAQRVLNTNMFRRGDVIAYFNINPQGDYNGKQDYTHSALYLGQDESEAGHIACHTICRHKHRPKNDEWWLKDGYYEYTLIHFSSGDPTPKDADHLRGWWKIDYFGKTEYYRLSRDGIARWTYTAPKAPTDKIDMSSQRKGHWFQWIDKVRLCWQYTGTVERWKVTGRKNAYQIKINDHDGTATKMFV
jgi:hypothetical protein